MTIDHEASHRQLVASYQALLGGVSLLAMGIAQEATALLKRHRKELQGDVLDVEMVRAAMELPEAIAVIPAELAQ